MTKQNVFSLTGVSFTKEKPRGFESHPLHLQMHPLSEYLRQHVREVTAKTYVRRLKTLSRTVDLDEPEKVKNIICTYQASEAYKQLLTNAYDYYVKFKGLTWVKPKFVKEEKPIFVPLESELNLLISRATLKLSVFLELLKGTGVDSGEAWKLRWVDINAENKTVDVTPTKNHNARTLSISDYLLARLFRLPRDYETVFSGDSLDLNDFRTGYIKMRNALALKLNKPRIHKIAFRSFRHWKATYEYWKTKDILHVKWLLGHKRLENTLVYTHLVNFGSDAFVCKAAKTVQEAKALIEEGFSYVCDVEGVKLFKKPK